MAGNNVVPERHFRNHLFREIYKNAWLKRISKANLKKSVSVQQKIERAWIVFCIHDDSEAFLEFYSDAKVSVVHRPNWFVSLNNTLHISPTICPDDREYEFVVTLQSCVVRLLAPSWEAMTDWVDVLRSKLTEMRILSPCENTYSALPETRAILLPTRDPMSPLPAPPLVPAAIVPGIEPISSAVLENQHPSANENTISHGDPAENIITPIDVSFSVCTDVDTSTSDVFTDVDSDVTTCPSIESSNGTRRRQVLMRNHSVPNATTITTAQNITIIRVSDEGSRSVWPVLTRVFDFDISNSTECGERLNSARGTNKESDEDADRISNTADDRTDVTDTAVTTASTEPSSSHTRVSSIHNCRGCRDRSLCTCSHYDRVYIPDISVLNRHKTRTLENESHTNSHVVCSSGGCRSSPFFHNKPEESLESNVDTPSSSSGHRYRSLSVSEINRSQSRSMTIDPLERSGREMIRLTLREQQVRRLRKEILHSSGVRIQLCRKDCLNAIALVDVFGCVWVAGWKQKEHPMLYNLLHIGDQVVSVAGLPIHSASDANKHLRAAMCNLYVEIVVRRVPFGRVFTLQKDIEGQSLGIVQENNTAVIREVVANSVAARHGLSQKATTCDGLSFTNWVLTEINARPLNLFFKNNEVRDRLNAVGREISILVQPLDLMKQLKKQLKSMRNYKDYIVQ